jgi:glycerophosphoryl diester phosphodiesterase
MKFALTLALLVLPLAAYGESPLPTPLPRAHAHNDYEHDRPLLDALDHGFCGIEADIFLIDGQLLVAHDLEDCDPDKTLQTLYLDPLLARARQHGGRIYPDGPNVILLVDIKNTGPATLEALLQALVPYHEMLTEFTRDSTTERAVTIVVSGSVPRADLEARSPRWAASDGRLPHIGASPHDVPLVSENWGTLFRWRGRGDMPGEERAKLEDILARCHAAGQKVRFWALPHRPEAWETVWDAGLDYINTDDLAGLRDFMLETMNAPTETAAP